MPSTHCVMAPRAVARHRDRQRGAALLMAMVIVTLVATVAASMVWQQWRATQVEGAERVRTQASWVLSGALDWARLILREDAKSATSQSDDLGEPWAIPLAEARLSTFLAADSSNNASDDNDTPDAFLSGKVDDAQAKYNIANLVQNGEVVPDEVAVLKRLLESLSMSPSLADGLADSLRKAELALESQINPEALGKLGGEQVRAQASIVPQSYDQLLWLGLDAGTLERLRPYVTLIPTRESTKVNINTASKEVIAAVVPGLDLARASRLVQARQRKPFKNDTWTDAFNSEAGPAPVTPTSSTWDIQRLSPTTNFFEVRGRLRYEDNTIEQRHLVQRINTDVVVRQQSRFSGLDRAQDGATPP